MKTFACVLFGLLLAAPAWADQKLDPPTGEAIVSPDAKLELLFTRTAAVAGGLTEGPAVAPDGSIYFTDIPFGADKGMIMRFDPRSDENDRLQRRQRQSQRADVRRRGISVRLRRERRRADAASRAGM